MYSKVRDGLLVVNTGNGKGKTTAALGVVLGAWGRGFRICVVQFIKAETGSWGEIKAAKKLGIDWFAKGDGFTWTSKDMDETVVRARDGWEVVKDKITSSNYDIIILDEFTYALSLGWLDTQTVIDWLRQNKPDSNFDRLFSNAADRNLAAHPLQRAMKYGPSNHRHFRSPKRRSYPCPE